MKSVLLCFLLLIAYSLATISDEQLQKLEPISKKCREQTGISLEKIQKVRQGGEPEADPKFKKHVLCMLKETGLITESGDFDTEIVKQKLKNGGTSDDVTNKVVKCAVKKDSPEDSAFEFMKCSIGYHFSPAD